MNLMDPANPMMSGVVQNQDSYMKGKIAQRWYYDQVAPALAGGVRGVLSQDGPAVRLRRCRTAARTPSTFWSAWAATWRRPRRRSISCATRKGIKAGCLNVYCFRPFPATQIVDALKHCQGVHGHRADGRSAFDDRQPSDARDQGGVLRRDQRARTARSRSTAFRGSITGRRDWAAATCGRATSIAIFDNMIDDGQDFFCVGIKHRAGADGAGGSRPAADRAHSRCAGIRSAASAR